LIIKKIILSFRHYIISVFLLIVSWQSIAQCNNKLVIEKPQIYKGNVTNKLLLITNEDSFKTISIVIEDNLKNVLLSKIINNVKVSKEGASIITFDSIWNKMKQEKFLKKCLVSCGNLPISDYYISVYSESNSGCLDTNYNIWVVDSILNPSCNLFKTLQQSIKDNLNKKPILLKQLKQNKQLDNNLSEQKLLELIDGVIRKTISSNFEYIQVENTGSEYQFSIENKRIGILKISLSDIINSIVENKIENTKNMFASEFNKDNEKLESINTKIEKELNEKLKETYLNGKIDVGNYYSNEQYEYSAQLPIYQEINAAIDLKLLGIPLNLEGFFTTQDINRNIKSSFLRLNFDVQKAKQDLTDIGKEYETLLDEKKGKVAGMSSLYSSYTESLKGKKKSILNEASRFVNSNKQLLIDSLENLLAKYNLPIDTAQIMNSLLKIATNKADSADIINDKVKKMEEWKTKSIEAKKNIELKLEEAKQLEIEIRKYEAIVNQYKQSLHFDTTILKNKVDSFLNTKKDISINGLQRKAKSILQEKGISKLNKRLNYFALGMINKEEGYFTNNGQTIRGVGLGVNFTNFETNIIGGRTEYIGRDGTLDKYNCISFKNTLHLKNEAKIGLHYYGYQLSNIQIDSNFWSTNRNQLNSISKPNPTNVFSISGEANFFKKLLFIGEIASSGLSFRNNKETGNSNQLIESIAHKYELSGIIPLVKWEGVFNLEHVGKNFENNTLPFIRKNFTTYGFTINGNLFKNLLQYKLSLTELNQNFNGNISKNRKMGLDLKTTSKQYPNILFSYKPFSSFKAINDTFIIQQRPLFGEVLTTKVTYHFKKNGLTHRFNLMQNRSKTISDTSKYVSEIYQLTYLLNSKANWMLNTNIGYSESPLLNGEQQQNKFIILSGNYNTKQYGSWNASFDVAYLLKNQLNKNGITLGNSFAIPKLKMQVSINARYMRYLNSEQTYKNIYSSFIGIQYQFSKRPLF
jgi:hypothetical protein